MNQIKQAALTLLTITSLGSCSLKQPMVQDAALSTDQQTVIVESDNVAAAKLEPASEGEMRVSTTIMVSSSRSWTVSVKTEDGGAWITTSENEHVNISGQMETTPLALTFERYKGNTERRATVTIHCAELSQELTIPITQNAFKPSLAVKTITDPLGISADGQDCELLVIANTSWHAGIDAQVSTVTPSVSMIEGENVKHITLSFPSNTNDELAHFATLVLSADGCESVRTEYVQTQSKRFFFLSEAVPSEIIPYESEVFIPLRSNGAWKAEISDCTFQNAVLTPSEGNSAYSGLYFTADHGADPEMYLKQATITITREGMEPIVVKFSQRGSIHLKFGTFDPEYVWDGQTLDDANSYKPYTTSNPAQFSSPTSFPYSYATGTYAGEPLDCITKKGGYTFTAFGQDCGVYSSAGAYLFCIGKMKDDYLMFPSIEGYRLGEMYYEASCRAQVPYTVRTEDGETIIQGGEYSVTTRNVPIERDINDMRHHIFPSTEAGARYRLNLEETFKFISVKDICLLYEK